MWVYKCGLFKEMDQASQDILSIVFKDTNIGRKEIYKSIPLVMKWRPKLLTLAKKGILRQKLLKKELNHKDMLVVLRHLARLQGKYILYKRKSVRENKRWKTAYIYSLTK